MNICVKRNALVMFKTDANATKWQRRGFGIVIGTVDDSREGNPIFNVRIVYPEPSTDQSVVVMVAGRKLIPIAENCDSTMPANRVISDRLPEILLTILGEIQSIKDWIKTNQPSEE